MKKIIAIFIILLVGKVSLCADFDTVTQEDVKQPVLTANIVFDWLDIDQTGRDAVIEKYKSELFGADTVYKYKKKEFKSEYKDYLKDSDYVRHYRLVSNDVKETDDENLCGFYLGKTLYSYAVQYKNNLRTVYYYDALGHLKYIDRMSDNYPNYPYYSKHYRVNGTLVSAIYFMSHDMQYMYNSNGSFKGAWYKDKMYDRHAKHTLTRNNW